LLDKNLANNYSYQPMSDYSTKEVSTKLMKEIEEALKSIKGWGSVEIYVQDFKVVQITERNIKKTLNGSDRQMAIK
jgi:hypothetical protein